MSCFVLGLGFKTLEITHLNQKDNVFICIILILLKLRAHKFKLKTIE